MNKLIRLDPHTLLPIAEPDPAAVETLRQLIALYDERVAIAADAHAHWQMAFEAGFILAPLRSSLAGEPQYDQLRVRAALLEREGQRRNSEVADLRRQVEQALAALIIWGFVPSGALPAIGEPYRLQVEGRVFTATIDVESGELSLEVTP